MPTPEPLITIRELTDADRSAVVALSDRLTIGVAAWRDHEAVSEAVLGWLEASTAADFAGVALVAEIGGGVVGSVSVDTETHFAGMSMPTSASCSWTRRTREQVSGRPW